MSQDILLTEEALNQRFPFQPNPLNTNAPFDFGAGGTMFETYGIELNYVIAQPCNRIWTLIDGDGGLCIISRFHVVNRLGYFISTQPIESSENFCVELEDDTDADCGLETTVVEEIHWTRRFRVQCARAARLLARHRWDTDGHEAFFGETRGLTGILTRTAVVSGAG